jgi:hypothetical protein
MVMERLILTVPDNQMRYWRRVAEKLKVNMEIYIREAVDRAMALDLDQEDPKWKKFNLETREQQQRILGLGAGFMDKDMRDYYRYQRILDKIWDAERKATEGIDGPKT